MKHPGLLFFSTIAFLTALLITSGCEINRSGSGSWHELPELTKPKVQPNIDKGGEFRTALAKLEKIKLPEGQPLKVVVTFHDLAYFGRGLTAGLVDIKTIAEEPVNLYTYQPDREKVLPWLKESQVVFKAGYGIDDWVDPLVEEAQKENPDLTVINTSRNIELMGNLYDPDPNNPQQITEYNPWYWTSPENVLSLADTFYQVFFTFYYDSSEKMLEGSERPKHNLGIFPSAQEQLGKIQGKILIQDVPAWTYFAKFFGISIVATLLPDGMTAPDDKRLEELAKSAKDNKVVAVIKTKGYGGDIADRFAKMANLPIIELEPHTRMSSGLEDLFPLTLGNANRLLLKFRELKLPEIETQPPAQQPPAGQQQEIPPEVKKQLEEAAKKAAEEQSKSGGNKPEGGK
jgi:ABC-type Zn uptake system ZnuABC Zn-binding protein ZnuA